MSEGDEERRGGPQWALVIGGVLVAVTVVASIGASDEEVGGSSERLGYVIASVAVPFAIAIAGRFLWVRFGSGRPPVVDWPWLLLIAGLIGAFLAVGRAGQEIEEDANAARVEPVVSLVRADR